MLPSDASTSAVLNVSKNCTRAHLAHHQQRCWCSAIEPVNEAQVWHTKGATDVLPDIPAAQHCRTGSCTSLGRRSIPWGCCWSLPSAGNPSPACSAACLGWVFSPIGTMLGICYKGVCPSMVQESAVLHNTRDDAGLRHWRLQRVILALLKKLSVCEQQRCCDAGCGLSSAFIIDRTHDTRPGPDGGHGVRRRSRSCWW